MRIVVTSDSHRAVSRLLDIIQIHKDSADLFINLGDGEDDTDTAVELFPTVKIERVAGNCDWYSQLPIEKVIECEGKKIFFTHGHAYSVKSGYSLIEQAAEEKCADICLFGHTHIPYENYKNGIHYLNPGSVREGSYGIIDIENGEIIAYCTAL